MEALFILAGLFFLLVVPVLAIRANLKLGALEREIAKLRDTRPFGSAAELVEQLKQDIEHASRVLG